MAGGSSATAYIPYSGQYRHYLTQLRLIPDAPPVPPTPHEMVSVSPPDSSETFSSRSTF
jgi:hypothetical protein